MSQFNGTFSADNQSSNVITLLPGQAVSYSITTASLTGSVVFEKTNKLGKGFSIVDTMTDTDAGTYLNKSNTNEHVRLRCVELDDDPGSETVTYSLTYTEGNDELSYEDSYDKLTKKAIITDFARTILDDADAATVRATIGVPSIVDAEDAQASVLDQIDLTSAEPESPTDGDRYINTSTGTSSETSQSVTANYIYEWNDTDSTWEETIPNEGAICTDEDANLTLLFNGSSWVNLAGYTVHNSLTGLQGGTTNEYYHLTSAQHTSVGNIVTAGHAEAMDQGVATTDSIEHVDINATGEYQVDGTKVVGTQGTAIVSITDSTGVSHNDTIVADGLTDSSGGSTDGTIAAVTDQSETTDNSVINDNFAEVAAAIALLESNDSDLAAKIEEILVALRTHGLIAT